MDILQMLYDSEINFQISCFWDGLIDWKLGDSLNGYHAQGKAETVAKANRSPKGSRGLPLSRIAVHAANPGNGLITCADHHPTHIRRIRRLTKCSGSESLARFDSN